METGQLIEDALSLDVSERANVALQILESISLDDSSGDQALTCEADRRDLEMDYGSESSMSEADFLHSFRHRL